MTIIRTPTEAKGGITPEEKLRMDEHAKLWISRAMRTNPIEPEKIIPAIEGLYKVAGLKAPRIVIVPSPMVMAFAYGASSAIWYGRKNGKASATYRATYSATRSATRSATDSATRSATYSATDSATRSATDSATRSATDSATDSATYSATGSATDSKKNAEKGAAEACFDLSGKFGLECSTRWYDSYQGGNMWAGYDCYLTACRDILGLELTSHAGYAYWEQAAIHGGFRVMHEEFCLVSDFPEVLKVDEENRPHCENGPSHRWRDGWCLYYWHGVQVPAHWIEDRENLDPAEILKAENVEQRAAGAAIIGWPKMMDVLEAKIIDSDPDPDHGDLIEMKLPGLSEPGLFLRAYCKRNGLIVEGVPRTSDIDGNQIKTVRAAQAWSFGKAEAEFNYPDFVS